MDDSSTASVTINVTSNDTDNDGVLNADDLCPDTSAGTVVDITGCPIFKLPDNNNKITIGSCTCNGKKDGYLQFSVIDANYDYTVTVSGVANPIKINGTSKSGSELDLVKEPTLYVLK